MDIHYTKFIILLISVLAASLTSEANPVQPAVDRDLSVTSDPQLLSNSHLDDVDVDSTQDHLPLSIDDDGDGQDDSALLQDGDGQDDLTAGIIGNHVSEHLGLPQDGSLNPGDSLNQVSSVDESPDGHDLENHGEVHNQHPDGSLDHIVDHGEVGTGESVDHEMLHPQMSGHPDGSGNPQPPNQHGLPGGHDPNQEPEPHHISHDEGEGINPVHRTTHAIQNGTIQAERVRTTQTRPVERSRTTRTVEHGVLRRVTENSNGTALRTPSRHSSMTISLLFTRTTDRVLLQGGSNMTVRTLPPDQPFHGHQALPTSHPLPQNRVTGPRPTVGTPPHRELPLPGEQGLAGMNGSHLQPGPQSGPSGSTTRPTVDTVIQRPSSSPGNVGPGEHEHSAVSNSSSTGEEIHHAVPGGEGHVVSSGEHGDEIIHHGETDQSHHETDQGHVITGEGHGQIPGEGPINEHENEHEGDNEHHTDGGDSHSHTDGGGHSSPNGSEGHSGTGEGEGNSGSGEGISKNKPDVGENGKPVKPGNATDHEGMHENSSSLNASLRPELSPRLSISSVTLELTPIATSSSTPFIVIPTVTSSKWQTSTSFINTHGQESVDPNREPTPPPHHDEGRHRSSITQDSILPSTPNSLSMLMPSSNVPHLLSSSVLTPELTSILTQVPTQQSPSVTTTVDVPDVDHELHGNLASCKGFSSGVEDSKHMCKGSSRLHSIRSSVMSSEFAYIPVTSLQNLMTSSSSSIIPDMLSHSNELHSTSVITLESNTINSQYVTSTATEVEPTAANLPGSSAGIIIDVNKTTTITTTPLSSKSSVLSSQLVSTVSGVYNISSSSVASITHSLSVRPTSSEAPSTPTMPTSTTTRIATSPIPISTRTSTTPTLTTTKHKHVNRTEKPDEQKNHTLINTTAATNPSTTRNRNRTNTSSVVRPSSSASTPRHLPHITTPITTQTPQRTTPPPVFIQIELKMTWMDFCNKKISFQMEVISILAKKQKVVEKEQIIINNLPLEECGIHPPNLSGETRMTQIRVEIYLVDHDGKVDVTLTIDCSEILESGIRQNEESYFKDKLVAVKLVDTHNNHGGGVGVNAGGSGDNSNNNNNLQGASNPQTEAKMQPGITMVIVIASIGGCCCLILIVLQLIIIKRRAGKKMRPYVSGQRVSIPSLDSVALGVLPKSRPTSGYWNPGLEDEEQIGNGEPSHLVNFAGLANFVMDQNAIYEEFKILPQEMPRLSCVPVGAEDKNRFANVLPYRHTRVRLRKKPDEDNSDYINANYISGYKDDKGAYIATQAPLEGTLEDFWRMVWEQQSRVVLMLTSMDESGQPHCPMYWPDAEGVEGIKLFGDLSVSLKKRNVQQEYTQSTLELKDMETNLVREVNHFWYTSWPLHGIPGALSLVKYILDSRPHYEDSGAPVIVHCSPGTGRTGTLIAIDICMRMFEDQRRVDILHCVHKMRQERAGSVQTKEQYGLIYTALNEYAVILSSPSLSTRSSVVTLHNML